ncbi:hypothetical protein [Salinithrix halophila]|uniref:Uncharacterized protein n=1 Tax=Salinithrix halophila TaxID=1485204 RepID=A0ABV8JBY1_9BACL
MGTNNHLFKESGGAVLVVAHALGLVLLLFGLYFTLLDPPGFASAAHLGWLLFHTTGGWMLLGGLSLFLISLAGLWHTRGRPTAKVPRNAGQRNSFRP